MGFEEGWTASHKRCNSVNHWNLKKWKKSSEHDFVSHFLSGGISAISIPESGKFFLWNLESWVLESGVQLKESGIPVTIGSSTDE